MSISKIARSRSRHLHRHLYRHLTDTAPRRKLEHYKYKCAVRWLADGDE